MPSKLRTHAALLALTVCTLLIHGYHPLSEDGGLYVAGIQSALDPTLFPHDIAFAGATRHYSLFTPIMAAIVRGAHIPLAWLLVITYFAGIWLLLCAAWRIARRCFESEFACLSAVALVAAWFALPIAGTSLLLMDPYVTARTISTPCSFLAIGFALGFEWRFAQGAAENRYLSLLFCAVALLIAGVFHPLMTAYAMAFVAAVLVAKLPCRPARIAGYTGLAVTALLVAGTLQLRAPAESAATVAAAVSRYYWFLSQWHWYEIFGIAGPLIVLALLLRFSRPSAATAALCRAGVALGLIATVVSVLFAHEHTSTHLVARLQPLRAFLLIYAVMIVLVGGSLAKLCLHRRRTLPVFAFAALACLMFLVARETYPASHHLELPGRAPINPWSQAFVWARDNTPRGALFALDSDYITTGGEDGQTFRAIAERSTLPDYSKDGGEAAVRPSLAAAWYAGEMEQKGLSRMTRAEREQRLLPLGVTWVILHANAQTTADCPYRNAVVEVCPLR